ncbi:MAG: MerR family transcriptional regulator [Planctomycetota bacterium]
MTSPHLKIGDFARLAGTNLRTLRYYEEMGLLEPASRSSGGFRYYRPADAHRVRLIHNLQELGLQLEQIREIIADGDGKPVDWRKRVDQALADQDRLITERVALLEKQRGEIQNARTKLAECGRCGQKPEESNNFCEPCALTGMSLPTLLAALFR